MNEPPAVCPWCRREDCPSNAEFYIERTPHCYQAEIDNLQSDLAAAIKWGEGRNEVADAMTSYMPDAARELALQTELTNLRESKKTLLGIAIEASELTSVLSIEAAQFLRLLSCYQRVEDTERLYDAICKSESVNEKLRSILNTKPPGETK